VSANKISRRHAPVWLYRNICDEEVVFLFFPRLAYHFCVVEALTGENQISWLLRREMQLRISTTSAAWSLKMRLF